MADMRLKRKQCDTGVGSGILCESARCTPSVSFEFEVDYGI